MRTLARLLHRWFGGHAGDSGSFTPGGWNGNGSASNVFYEKAEGPGATQPEGSTDAPRPALAIHREPWVRYLRALDRMEDQITQRVSDSAQRDRALYVLAYQRRAVMRVANGSDLARETWEAAQYFATLYIKDFGPLDLSPLPAISLAESCASPGSAGVTPERVDEFGHFAQLCGYAGIGASSEEIGHSVDVGATGVWVVDGGGKELQEPDGRALAGCCDQHRN